MTDETNWPLGPSSERDLVPDTASLRALAHPLRVRIVGILRRRGPSTASLLAQELGLNSGATSYHLRQLAGAGLIVEDTTRGNNRDRWWKAVHRSTYFDSTAYEDDPEAAIGYLSAVAAGYADNIVRAVHEYPALPGAWSESVDMSDFQMRVTAEESRQMRLELLEVIGRYRRDDDVKDGAVRAPEGAARVAVQLQILPDFADPA